jgi:hypothetical protein
MFRARARVVLKTPRIFHIHHARSLSKAVSSGDQLLLQSRLETFVGGRQARAAGPRSAAKIRKATKKIIIFYNYIFGLNYNYTFLHARITCSLPVRIELRRPHPSYR